MPVPPSQLKLTTYFWFDDTAEQAVDHYISIFPNSRITHTTYYLPAGQATHKKVPGTIQSIAFTLCGHEFVALNGGKFFQLSSATSFQIDCEDQAEVDYYWEKLGESGGDAETLSCGWLRDRFGVTWQVTPVVLSEMMRSEDDVRRGRLIEAMMEMKKLDVEKLKNAFDQHGDDD